jgi:TolB-like protein
MQASRGGPEAMLDAETFVFGPFRLVVSSRLLLANGEPIQLGSRAIDLLLALLRRRGQVVTKDELMTEAWPGTVVEENSLHVQMSALRKALETHAGSGRFISTVPGRGYRFVGQVEQLAGEQQRAMPSAPTAPPPLPEKPSIAVLPFSNISGDPEQDYFADGIVEDIITALARFPSLFVISRNSSFTYKGPTADIKQVSRELGVRYVLEGSIRKAGSRVRITGQLVQAESGMHVWAEHYDRDLSDIFALQDEMTARVVGAVVPSLQRAEIERARCKPPNSLDAYDLYLRALPAFYACTKESNKEALELLEKALALDPDFVAALLLAENCWSLMANQGWVPARETQSEVMRYARRAAQIDKDNAEALATLARRTAGIERNYEEANSLAERAVVLNPNSAIAWRQGGFSQIYAGRPEVGLEYLERAVRLSPLDARSEDSWAGIALALIQLERNKEAVAAGRRATQGNPNSATGWRVLSAALALTGQLEEARAAMRRLLVIDPNCTVAIMAVRQGYADMAKARYFDGLRKAGLPE